MRPNEPAASTIAEAVEYVVGSMSAADRAAVAALDESELVPRLHHGLGTWIRNELFHRGNPELSAACAAVLSAATAARVASDPVLARAAATFESLRPPPSTDDFSAVIIRRVWERLRQGVGPPSGGSGSNVTD